MFAHAEPCEAAEFLTTTGKDPGIAPVVEPDGHSQAGFRVIDMHGGQKWYDVEMFHVLFRELNAAEAQVLNSPIPHGTPVRFA